MYSIHVQVDEQIISNHIINVFLFSSFSFLYPGHCHRNYVHLEFFCALGQKRRLFECVVHELCFLFRFRSFLDERLNVKFFFPDPVFAGSQSPAKHWGNLLNDGSKIYSLVKIVVWSAKKQLLIRTCASNFFVIDFYFCQFQSGNRQQRKGVDWISNEKQLARTFVWPSERWDEWKFKAKFES